MTTLLFLAALIPTCICPLPCTESSASCEMVCGTEVDIRSFYLCPNTIEGMLMDCDRIFMGDFE